MNGGRPPPRGRPSGSRASDPARGPAPSPGSLGSAWRSSGRVHRADDRRDRQPMARWRPRQLPRRPRSLSRTRATSVRRPSATWATTRCSTTRRLPSSQSRMRKPTRSRSTIESTLEASSSRSEVRSNQPSMTARVAAAVDFLADRPRSQRPKPDIRRKKLFERVEVPGDDVVDQRLAEPLGGRLVWDRAVGRGSGRQDGHLGLPRASRFGSGRRYAAGTSGTTGGLRGFRAMARRSDGRPSPSLKSRYSGRRSAAALSSPAGSRQTSGARSKGPTRHLWRPTVLSPFDARKPEGCSEVPGRSQAGSLATE